MAVEPGNRSRYQTEDDTVGDVLPYLVLIEALVSRTVQTWELLVQAVGDGLTFTFIYIYVARQIEQTAITIDVPATVQSRWIS